MKKPIILAIDFDGVIHDYKKGWDGGKLHPPIEGAKESLLHLREKGFRIVIFSYRSKGLGQQAKMETWLMDYGIPYDEIYSGSGKPKADIFLDDRAVRFNGNWIETLKEVGEFKPWWKK